MIDTKSRWAGAPPFSVTFSFVIVVGLLFLFHHHYLLNTQQGEIFFNSVFSVNSAESPALSSYLLASLSHSDTEHLFRNTVAFVIPALIIERYLGKKALVATILTAAVLGPLLYDIATYLTGYMDGRARGSSTITSSVLVVAVSVIFQQALRRLGVPSSKSTFVVAGILGISAGLTVETAKYLLRDMPIRIAAAHIGGTFAGGVTYLAVTRSSTREDEDSFQKNDANSRASSESHRIS